MGARDFQNFAAVQFPPDALDGCGPEWRHVVLLPAEVLGEPGGVPVPYIKECLGINRERWRTDLSIVAPVGEHSDQHRLREAIGHALPHGAIRLDDYQVA